MATGLTSKIKADLGQVKFLTSAWADKHVQDALTGIAKLSKKTVPEIKTAIENKITKFNEVGRYSKILYETIAKNIIESELFNMLSDVKDDSTEKFDPVTFMALIRAVKSEHARFFPLRNLSDSKHLHNPRWILVPNDKEPEYINEVPTAAASADGRFIFNVNFMQKLLDYAAVKGLKPKSKKYSNNGGPFPPGYAYIEFLIIHELLHYTQSDFHYGKIYKDVSARLLNWVGDFRSNYELVKGGYEQLPIGLYSDHINYDRQNTYREMIDLVKKEMDKLPKKEQDKVGDALDSLTDDHSKKESEKSEPSDEDLAGKEAEVDKQGKATAEKMADKKDSKGGGDEGQHGEKSTGQPGKGNVSRANLDLPKVDIKPRFSWKALLSKAVRSAEETEETFMKPNKRSITGIEMARTRGSAAVKPGDLSIPGKIKLHVIVDSSGSMSSVLAKVYPNIRALLMSGDVIPNFYFSRFSDVHDEWECDVKSDKATEISTKKVDKVSSLFSKTYGGGTQLTTGIAEMVEKRHASGDITIMFSDSDVLAADNLPVLKKLIAMKTYVIFDDAKTFKSMVEKLKTVPYNASHL